MPPWELAFEAREPGVGDRGAEGVERIEPLQSGQVLQAGVGDVRVSEVACRCGCVFGRRPGDISDDVLLAFEDIRNLAGTALRINSGCRCPVHNSAVGGRPKSRHIISDALDIDCPDSLRFDDFAAICDEVVGDRGAVILYPAANFVHVDMRGRRLRMTV